MAGPWTRLTGLRALRTIIGNHNYYDSRIVLVNTLLCFDNNRSHHWAEVLANTQHDLVVLSNSTSGNTKANFRASVIRALKAKSQMTSL